MAQLFADPFFTALDADGAPISGARLNFYVSGTSTRQDSYSDGELGVVHANPVVADSAGRFAPIYLARRRYKVVLTDAAGVVIKTIDPVDNEADVSDRRVKPAGDSTRARPLAAHLSDRPNVLDWIPVAEHAAIRDGTTDYDAHGDIVAAIGETAPTSNDGGTIYFPRGRYLIGETLVVPTFVRLRGAGGRMSVLEAAAGFTGSHVVRLGGEALAFDCSVEAMRIDAAGIAGVDGVYSNRINETAGLSRCVIAGFGRTGVFVEHAGLDEAKNYFLEHLEIFPEDSEKITVTLTQSGGIATAASPAHGWSAGDHFGVYGANEAEYNGAFKITAVPTSDTFEFAVDSGAASPATGTVTASRCIGMRLDGNAAGSRGVDNVTVAPAGGTQLGGIGILVQKFAGLISRVHVEKMGCGICTGLDAASQGLTTIGPDLGPDLAVGVQIGTTGGFSTVNVLGVSMNTAGFVAIRDQPNSIDVTEQRPGFWAPGAGSSPNQTILTSANVDNRLRTNLNLVNAAALQVAGNQVVGSREAAIGKLTDSTGGTGGVVLGAVAGSGADILINNNFARLNDKIDRLIDRLSASSGHGLTSD